jgi:hypothetical protein
MPDRLTIEIFGTLHGAAEGRFAIAAFMLIALVVTRRLWWPQRHRRLDVTTPRRGGRESPNHARSPVSDSLPSLLNRRRRRRVTGPRSFSAPETTKARTRRAFEAGQSREN